MEANGQIVGCRLKPRKFDNDTVTDDDSLKPETDQNESIYLIAIFMVSRQ